MGHPTIKINDENGLTKCLYTKGVQQVVRTFLENNQPLRLVGGAVRDFLCEKIPKDLDFATTATPAQIKNMYLKKGFKVMKDGSGEDHGVIKCKIDEEEIEVATLRIDKVTDGRHAEIEFTKEWKLDAQRRDFTVNALYLDLQSGEVYDYFNGLSHLKEKKICFINDPALRIQEDFLRIMRYFRFHARIASKVEQHDQKVLEAIKKYGVGIKNIAGERIWNELKLLFGISNISMVKDAFLQMSSCGVLENIGFHKNLNINVFGKVCNNLYSVSNVHPMVLIASLIDDNKDVIVLNNKFKFSSAEMKVLEYILHNRKVIGSSSQGETTEKLKDLLVSTFEKSKKKFNKEENQSLQKFFELLKYLGLSNLIEKFRNYDIPTLPINGNDVMKACGKKRSSCKKVFR